MSNPVNNNIKIGRVRKGLSQEAMARKLSTPEKPVSRSTYANYENDTEPRLHHIEMILKYFGISGADVEPFLFNENFWEK